MIMLRDLLSQNFFVVNNDIVTSHIRYDCISWSTSKNFMILLATFVEKNISTALLDWLSHVIDRQTTPQAHHVSVLATYPSQNNASYQFVCLTMSPLEDGTAHDAEKHVKFLYFVRNVFGKDMTNMVEIIRDSCSVNWSVGTNMGAPPWMCLPLIPTCRKKILAEEEDIVLQVKQLMTKLRTLLIFAKIRRKTHLNPKLKNDTRWSSRYEML